ncbi:MAG: TIM-barrel domain-containing protein [Planctomycetota bacterium]
MSEKSKHRHHGTRTVIDRAFGAIGMSKAERYVPAGESQLIGDGIARFFPQTLKPEDAEPSLAVVAELESKGPAPAAFGARPEFAVRRNGQRIAHVWVAPGTDLYGTGETAGPLRRNGRKIVNWNSDCACYTDRNPSLYQSHPWVLAVRADGSAFGVLADTTWRCEIDLGEGITFRSSGPDFPVYVIDRDSPQEVLKGLAELTGTMQMPPLWSLGYQQCRWSYEPDSRVKEIADGFRDRSIPCDVIWMDIDYMNRYQIFTFDEEKFPDPKGLSGYLHERKFKGVWMIDPAPEAKAGYFIYDQGTEKDYWVKDHSGKPFVGKVWPPECVWPDFTRGDVCEWWAGLYKDFLAQGVDGVWNDMNEPAVIDSDMPETNRHAGGSWQGLDLPADLHARYHNVYGMLMVRASREGLERAAPDKRPFILTRSNFLGGHRYAATWTGDNNSTWNDVQWSISMVLNMGLSGQPFVGPDLGGFFGEGTPEMFAQWYGFGTLLPFARGHATKENIDKEPWVFGDAVETTCRRAIERRYRLLPYLYTLFREAHETGLPVCRPVFFADPKDPGLRSEDHAFLLGDAVLVEAKATAGMDHAPARPKGIWRRFDPIEHDGDRRLADLSIRGGAIVPMGPVVQSTEDYELAELTLVCSPDERGRATGTLYEDSGDGHDHQDGAFRLTRFDLEREEDGTWVLRASIQRGDWPSPAYRHIRVVVLGERHLSTEPVPHADEIRLGELARM